MGLLMSFIPEGNWFLFGVNSFIAFICMLIFIVLWQKHRQHSKRYFSLLSYVMLNGLAIYATIPILRMIYGTLTFWVGIIFLVVSCVFPYFFLSTLQ